MPQTKPPLFCRYEISERCTSSHSLLAIVPCTINLQRNWKKDNDSEIPCILECNMQSFPEANYSALRAGVTCRSLDTINPGVQVSNQISLWQALWDYPRVLWARWAPRQAALLGNSGPASLAACRSLAGPGRAVEARGLPLTSSSHCQGSASTGMYGQDGSLHYTTAGNRTRKWKGSVDHY